MEDNVIKKKKIINTILVLIIIILLIICYFVYKSIINNSNNNSDSNKPSVIDTKEDINKIGEEKFNLLNSKTNINNNKPIFFTNNDINTNNINNQDILIIAYSLISSEDKNKTGNVNNYCFDKTLDLYTDDCYKEVFDKAILQEQINNFFGTDITVTYEDFKTFGNLLCTINDNTYTCTLNKNHFENDFILTVSMYDNAKVNGDYLEVYSYLLTIVRVASPTKQAGIYSDASTTNKIDEITFFNENVKDNLSNENYKLLINKYKDKITKYKSLFKKVKDEYVWVSTSIEKK